MQILHSYMQPQILLIVLPFLQELVQVEFSLDYKLKIQIQDRSFVDISFGVYIDM